MSNFIPKIGLFQELLISERIHLNQVSQLFLLVQTLLYHDLAKNLAQNCPKNYYQHSTGGVLYSKLINSSSLCWFDGKKCSFFRKIHDRIFDDFSTLWLKKLLKSWFHEIFWAWLHFIVLFHTVQSVEIAEICSHRKKIRQINYLEISLVKTLLSRNFCQKWVRVNFRNFHTVLWESYSNSFSVKLTFFWRILM